MSVRKSSSNGLIGVYVVESTSVDIHSPRTQRRVTLTNWSSSGFPGGFKPAQDGSVRSERSHDSSLPGCVFHIAHNNTKESKSIIS